jgi:hypothetical protein
VGVKISKEIKVKKANNLEINEHQQRRVKAAIK